MSIQMAGVARGEENAVKNGFGIHCALVPGENLGGTVTAILPALVRPVALHVVVMDKALVDGKDLLMMRGR